MAAIPKNLFSKIMPQIRQYEATTGRKISQKALQALMKGELNVASERAMRDRDAASVIATRKADLDLRRQALADKKKAAKASGLVQLGGMAIQGGQLLKSSGLFGGTKIAETAPVALSTTAPTATALSTGAQLQTVGTLTAPTAAVTAPSLTGVAELTAPAATTATTTAGASVMPSAPQLAAVTASAKAGGWLGAQKSFQEITPWGGKNTERKAGAAIGGAIAGGMVAGPVGAVVGGLYGLASESSVICTELNRQGHISDELLVWDSLYRVLHIDDNVYCGYLTLAMPVVRAMRRSKVVTALVRPLGVACANEMAHRVKPERFNGNVLGKVILKVGSPVCRLINTLNEKTREVIGGTS